MSALTLTKQYADGELLFKEDFDIMLDELEAKVNGTLDDDNMAANWGNLGQLTLEQDQSFTFGATDSAYVRYVVSSDDLRFGVTTAAKDTIFKVEGAEAARIDSTSNDLKIQKDLYFKDRSTTYGLFYLMGNYKKPVLVYVNSTTVEIEENTLTDNQSLIVFPTGPIAVTEDTSSTHKFRRLVTSATANGYDSDDTGAADSGLRQGLSLAANTWYAVYAARVRYGDDAGNNFILVVDDTMPAYSNWGTLDTRYGANQWVYLGMLRRGYGVANTTTLIPFQQDNKGWTRFIDRGAANDMFGIEISNSSYTATTNASMWTMGVGNSGNNIPDHLKAVSALFLTEVDGDGELGAAWEFGLSTSSPLINLPSMADTFGSRKYSINLQIPVISGAVLSARRFQSGTSNDGTVEVYVTGFLDHLV